jgi:hypothetical protein
MAKAKRDHTRQDHQHQAEKAPPVVHALVAPDYTLGSPDFARPAADDFQYIGLMLRTRDHFRELYPEGSWPKIEQLAAFLRQQRLCDGSPISKRLINAMATMLRPTRLQSGGRPPNSKQKGDTV